MLLLVGRSMLMRLLSFCQLTVWDVFLVDSDFRIERPTRYYRQGLNVFHQLEDDEDVTTNGPGEGLAAERRHASSRIGSIKGQISKALHIGHRHDHRESQSANGHADSFMRRDSSPGPSSPPSSRPLTPMLDPSTNTDPLLGPDDHDEQTHEAAGDGDKKKKNRSNEVSKHTFYIENAQMRLKLFAKNEVSRYNGLVINASRKLMHVCFLASDAPVDCCVRASGSRLSLYRQKPL